MTTVSSRRYYPGHNYCIQCTVPGQDYCSIRFLKHQHTGAAPWVASHAFMASFWDEARKWTFITWGICPPLNLKCARLFGMEKERPDDLLNIFY